MNVSYYVIYWPYRITWSILKLFRKKKSIIFYCGSHTDYAVIKPLYKYFPEAKIVAKNRKVQKALKEYGITSSLYPSFPDVLVMPRHVARKFPEPRMKKVGLRHGAYHFKDFVEAERYNAFDIYFVTSIREVELALKRGITSAQAIGFPKLDPAFNGCITEEVLEQYREKIGLDNKQPVVIFATTWNKAGTSAINRWIDHLSELTLDYQVLVTVHQWTTKDYIKKLENTPDIIYIKDKDIIPYLMLADVMVCDKSSIIAEFCALDKPIVTFSVPDGRRPSIEVNTMLTEISIQVDTYEEMKEALKEAVLNPDKLAAQRKKYNKIMFDKLDGKAGFRAASIIREKFLG